MTLALPCPVAKGQCRLWQPIQGFQELRFHTVIVEATSRVSYKLILQSMLRIAGPTGKGLMYLIYHLLKNFPHFIVIHTVKGFVKKV